jgi:hypothetical protein
LTVEAKTLSRTELRRKKHARIRTKVRRTGGWGREAATAYVLYDIAVSVFELRLAV